MMERERDWRKSEIPQNDALQCFISSLPSPRKSKLISPNVPRLSHICSRMKLIIIHLDANWRLLDVT
jgi:hypothetical protein